MSKHLERTYLDCPAGTKFVIESCGSHLPKGGHEFVHEFLEFPNGTIHSYGIRPAHPCTCAVAETSIVPSALPLPFDKRERVRGRRLAAA